MDFLKTEVKPFRIEPLCDSCGGNLKFREEFDDGFDYKCVDCGADRHLMEKYPKIVYEDVGEPILI